MTTASYRLRVPGPTAVPERVRQATARPVLHHRGPEFRALLGRAEELLKPILGTRRTAFLFASSGTGMMEASLVNVLAPGDRVLVCIQGQFGERFAEIAAALGAEVDRLETPWGEMVDPAAVERRIATADYRAVVVVHNESSTGVITNLPALGAVFRNRPELLIVDSVSGVGGIEMRQEEWGVDVVASASQKALMCPPGIGIASLSDKAWEAVNRRSGMARFYWDFRKAAASVEKSETPFTPPVSLMAGLCEALEMIHEEGLPNVLARHQRLSAMLREGCARLGLFSYGQADSLSNTVVALKVPKELNGGNIVRLLYDRHKTVIAGSRNQLSGRVIRIGTMGHFNEDVIRTDLSHLESVLRELRGERDSKLR